MIEYVCQRCKGFFSNVDCTSATISENQLSKSSDLRISLHISWWASREKVPFIAMTVMGPPQTWDLLSVKVPSAMLLTSSWWMWNFDDIFLRLSPQHWHVYSARAMTPTFECSPCCELISDWGMAWMFKA